MPNGGSDCCGTCPFNEKNGGEVGYAHASDPGRDFCIIREVLITGPAFYTYCANHPHHNPDGVDVPVGPIYQGESDGRRWIWVEAVDTASVRERAVAYLSRLQLQWRRAYPFGVDFASEVIRQLGKWHETRALPALQRLATAPVPPPPPGYHELDELRRAMIASPVDLQRLAHETLIQIEHGE